MPLGTVDLPQAQEPQLLVHTFVWSFGPVRSLDHWYEKLEWGDHLPAPGRANNLYAGPSRRLHESPTEFLALGSKALVYVHHCYLPQWPIRWRQLLVDGVRLFQYLRKVHHLDRRLFEWSTAVSEVALW